MNGGLSGTVDPGYRKSAPLRSWHFQSRPRRVGSSILNGIHTIYKPSYSTRLHVCLRIRSVANIPRAIQKTQVAGESLDSNTSYACYVWESK